MEGKSKVLHLLDRGPKPYKTAVQYNESEMVPHGQIPLLSNIYINREAARRDFNITDMENQVKGWKVTVEPVFRNGEPA